jgi:arylformamidase
MDPFRIRDFVTDFAAREADYREASDATRRALPSRLDVSYGSRARERLDLFFPTELEGPTPVHLFIHGGYWRAGAKEDHAFVADAITASGAIGAIVEYDLVPSVGLADQVRQVRRAVEWIARHAPEFGGDPARLSASGHSAGAMLCWFLSAAGSTEEAPPAIRPQRILLVSGIYDLAPIATSFLQPELHLTERDIAEWSPLNGRLAQSTAVTLAVGEEETRPFHSQARALAAKFSEANVQVLGGLNHMSVVRELGRPGTAAAQLLQETIGSPSRA